MINEINDKRNKRKVVVAIDQDLCAQGEALADSAPRLHCDEPERS